MRKVIETACWLVAMCCVGLVPFSSFVMADDGRGALRWTEVVGGVWRTESMPRGYALVDGDRCVLFGVPERVTPQTLPPNVTQCELVVLTHHHRDTSWSAAAFVQAKIPVRAPKLAEVYLSPDGVAAYWEKSMPRVPVGRFPALLERYWGDWTYLVHPVGIAGVTCDIADGNEWMWRGWTIKALATPGHSKDHMAFLVGRSRGLAAHATLDGLAVGERVCFCGDAIARPGTMWSPYTLEWHHQKDEGAVAAALSLRAIAPRNRCCCCPNMPSRFVARG